MLMLLNAKQTKIHLPDTFWRKKKPLLVTSRHTQENKCVYSLLNYYFILKKRIIKKLKIVIAVLFLLYSVS